MGGLVAIPTPPAGISTLSRTTKSKGTTYQATNGPGFIHAYITSGGSSPGNAIGYVGSASPAADPIAKKFGNYVNEKYYITFPVLKDQYYKLDIVYESTYTMYYYYWS